VRVSHSYIRATDIFHICSVAQKREDEGKRKVIGEVARSGNGKARWQTSKHN
jgi:hypothetical protein